MSKRLDFMPHKLYAIAGDNWEPAIIGVDRKTRKELVYFTLDLSETAKSNWIRFRTSHRDYVGKDSFLSSFREVKRAVKIFIKQYE